MRGLLLLFIVGLCFSSMAQVKVGFSLGGLVISDRYEVKYIETHKSYGGQLGVEAVIPVLKNKLAIETGLHFYNYSYNLIRSNEEIWFSNGIGNVSSYHDNFNVLGLSLPVALAWSQWKVQPFVGANFLFSFSSQKETIGHLERLGVRNSDNIRITYEATDTIRFAPLTISAIAGINYVLTRNLKLRVQYSMGLNDFIAHRISPKIVDGVNVGGTTVYGNRKDQFQLMAIYIPDWGKNKVERQKRKAERPSFNERIKMLYQ